MMDNVAPHIKVIAVLGTSFSGSTLVNLILGSHSNIYGGGELSGLFLHRGKTGGSCTTCGFSCQYWSDANREAVSKSVFYRFVAGLFGKQIIVDTSKSIQWFIELLSLDNTVRPYYVLMVKHPIRYLASCMNNIYFFDKPPQATWWGRVMTRLDPQRKRRVFLDKLLLDLLQYYRNLFGTYGQLFVGERFQMLHYERLIDNPKAVLSPLLEDLGLSFDPRMANCYSQVHHQIGGNTGALYQTSKSWCGGDHSIPDYRKQFYETMRGIAIDDKYKMAFSSEELHWLRRHPAVEEVSRMLGYSDPRMPFPIV